MNQGPGPMSLEQIEAAALALPEPELELLVERLEARLCAPAGETDRSWRAEVRRRVEEIRAGRVELIEGEDVLAELDTES